MRERRSKSGSERASEGERIIKGTDIKGAAWPALLSIRSTEIRRECAGPLGGAVPGVAVVFRAESTARAQCDGKYPSTYFIKRWVALMSLPLFTRRSRKGRRGGHTEYKTGEKIHGK